MRFATRYIVQEWWFALVLPRIGLGDLARRGRPARFARIAARFHVLAVELGGLMIKVGQFLSSRLDVLPPEITSELESLQDEVPPVPFEPIRALAEAELGVPLDRAYASFDREPVAAASLGQVHRARLSPDDAAQAGFADVVVKIQRPGIDEIIDVDLRALRRIARWLARIGFIAQRVDLPALVEEFAATSRQEVDYLHEAAGAERFAGAFAGDPHVEAPVPAWERTTRRVLTLSDVTAIKISDHAGLRAAGIDPHRVAEALAAAMFDQLFRDGFFHADPHPGNIFVTPRPGTARGWALTFVDFGMMGEIPDTLRSGLQKLLIAVAARDGKGLVAAISGMGVLLPSADEAQLEKAMTELFARFGGMAISDLQNVDPHEFEDFARRFGEVLRTMPFQLPENFLLVIRAASVTSGVCSALDPHFNMWKAVEPYAQQLIRDQGKTAVRDAAQHALSFARVAAALPQRIDTLVTLLESGRLRAETPAIDRRMSRLERAARRVVSAVLFAGLLIGGILLHPSDAVFGAVLMGVSVLPLLHTLLAGIGGRSRS
ncbi:AarF/UbiB family protein [Microbacterium horticulturae]|uniref:AarF/UbiB family protein n=1 Tax=Microbacterium horticulturae TaxID=3028316 RepID=A0ABY8C2Q5_9MICO|nr:AarF/UbiB family protein [Microbacterium sp. KACC 23027]WEG10735.1 AarF/UbiB family protein [Microbacterium sp. KACC 23027]